jgi:hypothetical protein
MLAFAKRFGEARPKCGIPARRHVTTKKQLLTHEMAMKTHYTQMHDTTGHSM